MWLDAVALLILGVFIGIGALRGALLSALGLLTLGAGYGAAIWSAPRFGPALADELGVAEIFGIAGAGTAAFVAVFFVMSIVGAIAKRVEKRKMLTRSSRDRFLGAVFGGIRGSLVVLLISWLAIWVDALRATGVTEAVPEIGSSQAAAVTGSVIEASVEAAMDEGPSSRMLARMAARPGTTLVEVQDLVENPNVGGLRQDPLFWTYVESGAVESALNTGSFLRVTHDASLRQRLGELGVIEPDAAADPAAFREAAADVLRHLGPRLRALRNDPALQELVEDPEVQTALQSGDTMALVSHPGFRQLVARVASDPAE